MKKFIVYVIMFNFFMFSQAQRAEANPAVIVAGAVALGTMLFVAGAVKYSAPVLPTTNYFSNLGTIGRIGVATWSIANSYGTETLQNKTITLKTSFNELMNKVVTPYISNNSGSPYPGLYNELVNPPPVNESLGPFESGSIHLVNTKYYQIDAVIRIFDMRNASPPPASGTGSSCYGGGSITYSNKFCYASGPNGGGMYTYVYEANWHEVGAPGTTPKTVAQVRAKMNTLPISDNPFEIYKGEIDDFIKNQPNSWHSTDTMNPESDIDTAPTFVPPQGAVLPGTLPIPLVTPYTAAQDLVKIETGRLTDAQTKLKEYETAHPWATPSTDPVLSGLRDAVTVAQGAVASAGTQVQTLSPTAADVGTATMPTLGDGNSYDGNIEPPEKKSILTLLTSFLSGSPLVAMVQSFKVTTADANCSVFVGEVYGQPMVIDLCRWDPHLRAVGGMFLIIMQGYAVLVVIRGW